MHRRSVDQRGREGRGIHMLSDEMHDGLFQHRGGQSPAGEVLLATVLDEAPGDVVAEPLPVFLFGVARRQPVPGLVEELACQWGTGCTGLRRASPWFGSPCLQLRLDRVPGLRSNDRWMLALVDTPLVPDAAGVERIPGSVKAGQSLPSPRIDASLFAPTPGCTLESFGYLEQIRSCRWGMPLFALR